MFVDRNEFLDVLILGFVPSLSMDSVGGIPNMYLCPRLDEQGDFLAAGKSSYCGLEGIY